MIFRIVLRLSKLPACRIKINVVIAYRLFLVLKMLTKSRHSPFVFIFAAAFVRCRFIYNYYVQWGIALAYSSYYSTVSCLKKRYRRRRVHFQNNLRNYSDVDGFCSQLVFYFKKLFFLHNMHISTSGGIAQQSNDDQLQQNFESY